MILQRTGETLFLYRVLLAPPVCIRSVFLYRFDLVFQLTLRINPVSVRRTEFRVGVLGILYMRSSRYTFGHKGPYHAISCRYHGRCTMTLTQIQVRIGELLRVLHVSLADASVFSVEWPSISANLVAPFFYPCLVYLDLILSPCSRTAPRKILRVMHGMIDFSAHKKKGITSKYKTEANLINFKLSAYTN